MYEFVTSVLRKHINKSDKKVVSIFFNTKTGEMFSYISSFYPNFDISKIY